MVSELEMLTREEFASLLIVGNTCRARTASSHPHQTQCPADRAKQNGLPSRTNVCTRRKRTCGLQGGSPGLRPNSDIRQVIPSCRESPASARPPRDVIGKRLAAQRLLGRMVTKEYR